MLRNLEVNTGTERPSSSSVPHDSYGRIDVLGRNQRTSVDRPEINTNQGMSNVRHFIKNLYEISSPGETK